MKRFQRALNTELHRSMGERHVSICFFYSAQTFDIDSEHQREADVTEALKYIPHGASMHQRQPERLIQWQREYDAYLLELSSGLVPPLPVGVDHFSNGKRCTAYFESKVQAWPLLARCAVITINTKCMTLDIERIFSVYSYWMSQFAGINLKEGKLYKAYNTQNKRFVW